MTIQNIIDNAKTAIFDSTSSAESQNASATAFIEACARDVLDDLYRSDLSFIVKQKVRFSSGKCALTALKYTIVELCSLTDKEGARKRVREEGDCLVSDDFDGDGILEYRAKYDVPTSLAATLTIPEAYSADGLKLGAAARYFYGRGLVDEGNFYAEAFDAFRNALKTDKKFEKKAGVIKGRAFV